MITDWNDIRAVRYSPMTPPPEWPPNVRPISTEGVSLLGIDPATNQLYLDGNVIAFFAESCQFSPLGHRDEIPWLDTRHSLNGLYGILGRIADHSALMLAARITLPHFSASSSSRLA